MIEWMFKLYPWEFMLQEEFGPYLLSEKVQWLEPIWKCILSNKALLPMLWKLFPNHPNLLPAYFEDEFDLEQLDKQQRWVKKPIFSREGANITILDSQQALYHSDGPYGEEGFINVKNTVILRNASNRWVWRIFLQEVYVFLK